MSASANVPFVPPLLSGIIVDSQKPFKFDFLLDTGNRKLNQEEMKSISNQLIKYFLAALTIPENKLWVNLSPAEPKRIVDTQLGQTAMGQEMLAEDFLLKKLTASVLSPENEAGRKFWDAVYEKIYENRREKTEERQATKNKATPSIVSNLSALVYPLSSDNFDIPVDILSRVWIVPSEAEIYQNGNKAYVVKARLKVMTERDYLRTQRDEKNKLIQENIIPVLEKEVNEGEQFAPLRQIYYSYILAMWYKKTLHNSIVANYADKQKISGIENGSPANIQKIYDQYLTAFRKGTQGIIKEEYDLNSQQIVPRKYLTGGVILQGKYKVNPDGAMLLKPYGQIFQVAGNFENSNLTDHAMINNLTATNDVPAMSLDYWKLKQMGLRQIGGGEQTQVESMEGWPFVVKSFWPYLTDREKNVAIYGYDVTGKSAGGLVAEFVYVKNYLNEVEKIIMRKAERTVDGELTRLIKEKHIKESKKILDEYFDLLSNLIRRGLFPWDAGFQHIGIIEGKQVVIDPGVFVKINDPLRWNSLALQLESRKETLEDQFHSPELADYFQTLIDAKGFTLNKIAESVGKIYGLDSPQSMPDISQDIAESITAADLENDRAMMVKKSVEAASAAQGRSIQEIPLISQVQKRKPIPDDVKIFVFDWDDTISKAVSEAASYIQAPVLAMLMTGKENSADLTAEEIEHGRQFFMNTLGRTDEQRYQDAIAFSSGKSEHFQIKELLKQYYKNQADFIASHLADWRREMNKHLVPGVLDFILTLREYGYKMYILSANAYLNELKVVDALGMGSYFFELKNVTNAGENNADFSKGAELEKLALREEVRPDQIVMIGDGSSDMRGAREAGTISLAVAEEFNKQLSMAEKFDPHIIIPDFRDVGTLVKILQLKAQQPLVAGDEKIISSSVVLPETRELFHWLNISMERTDVSLPYQLVLRPFFLNKRKTDFEDVMAPKPAGVKERYLAALPVPVPQRISIEKFSTQIKDPQTAKTGIELVLRRVRQLINAGQWIGPFGGYAKIKEYAVNVINDSAMIGDNSKARSYLKAARGRVLEYDPFLAALIIGHGGPLDFERDLSKYFKSFIKIKDHYNLQSFNFGEEVAIKEFDRYQTMSIDELGSVVSASLGAITRLQNVLESEAKNLSLKTLNKNLNDDAVRRERYFKELQRRYTSLFANKNFYEDNKAEIADYIKQYYVNTTIMMRAFWSKIEAKGWLNDDDPEVKEAWRDIKGFFDKWIPNFEHLAMFLDENFVNTWKKEGVTIDNLNNWLDPKDQIWDSKGNKYQVTFHGTQNKLEAFWPDKLVHLAIERLISNGYHAIEKNAAELDDQLEHVDLYLEQNEELAQKGQVKISIENPGRISYKVVTKDQISPIMDWELFCKYVIMSGWGWQINENEVRLGQWDQEHLKAYFESKAEQLLPILEHAQERSGLELDPEKGLPQILLLDHTRFNYSHGIGLPFAVRVFQRMGGKVEIKNTEHGKIPYTRFEITLPLSPENVFNDHAMMGRGHDASLEEMYRPTLWSEKESQLIGAEIAEETGWVESTPKNVFIPPDLKKQFSWMGDNPITVYSSAFARNIKCMVKIGYLFFMAEADYDDLPADIQTQIKHNVIWTQEYLPKTLLDHPQAWATILSMMMADLSAFHTIVEDQGEGILSAVALKLGVAKALIVSSQGDQKATINKNLYVNGINEEQVEIAAGTMARPEFLGEYLDDSLGKVIVVSNGEAHGSEKRQQIFNFIERFKDDLNTKAVILGSYAVDDEGAQAMRFDLNFALRKGLVTDNIFFKSPLVQVDNMAALFIPVHTLEMPAGLESKNFPYEQDKAMISDGQTLSQISASLDKLNYVYQAMIQRKADMSRVKAADILAEDILRHDIHKVVVVGTGLTYLPVLLSLSGLEVIFIDNDEAKKEAIDIYVHYWAEQFHVNVNYRSYKVAFGSSEAAAALKEDLNRFDLVTMVDFSGEYPENWAGQVKALLEGGQGYVVLDAADQDSKISSRFNRAFKRVEDINARSFSGEFSVYPGSLNKLFYVRDEAMISDEGDRSQGLNSFSAPEEKLEFVYKKMMAENAGPVKMKDKAYQLSKEILQHHIQKVAVVGKGLYYLPIFLALSGLEVVFIDMDASVKNNMDAYIKYCEEIFGVSALNYRSYQLEFGSREGGVALRGEMNKFDLVTMVDLVGGIPHGVAGWAEQTKALLKNGKGYAVLDVAEFSNEKAQLESRFAEVFPKLAKISGAYQGEYLTFPRSTNVLFSTGDEEVNPAQERAPGGIDFNSQYLNLKTRGQSVDLSVDPAQLQQINIEGLIPVITSIALVPNLSEVLR
ncbi:MAG: HAD hydrolase-like protein [Candidatus Omnitrophica bacterium]|nr:HAD hydrolase-like protein [Candidatus Omnitrophota bacterium]